jgi:hypothetical protein
LLGVNTILVFNDRKRGVLNLILELLSNMFSALS